MTGMKWFRVYSEIKDDPKVLELDDHQRWLWICLLAMASESSTRGTITNVRPRGLAASLRTDEGRLDACLGLLSDLNMVDYDQITQTIEILHWCDRQYDKPSDTPDATRDRKRMSRQRHADVTLSHATDTDTDTDTDTEDTLTANAVSDGTPQPPPESAPKAKRTAAKKPTDPNMQNPGVMAFREIAHKFPNHVQAAAIVAAVSDDKVDLWRMTIERWLRMGWSPQNVDGMIGRFENGWADIDARRNGPQPAQEKEPAYKRAIRAFIEREGLTPNGI